MRIVMIIIISITTIVIINIIILLGTGVGLVGAIAHHGKLALSPTSNFGKC